jgi:cell division septum initiation protein DivIVA
VFKVSSDKKLFHLFNSIEDLQRKNELYIRTIRKLEVEKERFISDSNSNSNSKFNEDLLSYAKELESLREYRQQTEEIVQAIVQERDAYKAMIDERDISSSPLKLTNNGIKIYDSGLKITELEDEIKRLTNYNNRIINAEQMLTETLEKTKTECSSLRLQVVARDSDLRFYKGIILIFILITNLSIILLSSHN